MYPKQKFSPIYALYFTFISFYRKVKLTGHSLTMDDYEKRKLSVFNQINFLGIVAGLTVSIAGLFDDQSLPVIATIVAFSPVVISLFVILLNYHKKYEWARLVYFSLYPVLTSMVYGAGMDLGLELFFVLYAALAIFYMQKPANAILSYVLVSGCYLMVYVFSGSYDYTYRLSTTLFPFYVFVHVLALVLLFFALFWLKKENIGYQLSILHKNKELHKTNLKIEKQKKEIAQKAEQLNKLNSTKDKLFSVISHDLRGPVYAQRNLFQNIQQYNMPGEKVKELIPEVLKDMNYTISLIDNLLQWAKSQMQSESVDLQIIDISEVVNSVVKLLGLQASGKNVSIRVEQLDPAYVFADKDMIQMVLRNLVSNAIKFTENNGEVSVELIEMNNLIEVCIHDTGIGMTKDILEKISQNNFYSTK
ncbi:MAG: HAMP domain-containing sensor histidine kinase, partial [Ginsengibacter sp.]